MESGDQSGTQSGSQSGSQTKSQSGDQSGSESKSKTEESGTANKSNNSKFLIDLNLSLLILIFAIIL